MNIATPRKLHPKRNKTSAVANCCLVVICIAGVVAAALRLGLGLEGSLQFLIVIAVSLVGAVLLSLSVSAPRHGRTTRVIEVGLLAFVIVTMVANLSAEASRPSHDLSKLWQQTFLGLWPMLLYFPVRDWAATRVSVATVDIGFLIMSVFAMASIWLQFFGVVSVEAYGTRYFGFIGDGVAWLVALAGVYFFYRRRLFLVLALFISLLMTQSRAPILVLLLGLAMYPYLFGFKSLHILRDRRILLFCLAGLPLVLLFGGDFVAEVWNASWNRLLETDLLESDRIASTEFTLKIFLENPLLGAGYNAHPRIFGASGFTGGEGSGVLNTQTSTLAQVLADSGVVGFFSFFALLIGFILAVRELARLRSLIEPETYLASAGLAAWLLPFSVGNQSAAWLIPGSQLSPFVFIAAGIIVGVIRAARGPRRIGAKLRD